LLPGLKGGEQGVVGKRSRLSRTLVVAQLAFSVVLLTSAGIAYRALSMVNTVELAVDTSGLLLVTVNPSLDIPDRQTNLLLLERLRQRLRTITGVSSVSYIRMPPRYPAGVQVAQADLVRDGVRANVNYVGPDYLRALGIDPILGREFTPNDRFSPTKSALINQELATALWPGQSAVGQTLLLGSQHRPVEELGVFPNALFIDRRVDPSSKAYIVLRAEQQDPAPVVGQASVMGSGEIAFYLPYSGNLNPIEAAAGTAVRNVDDRIALVYMRTMPRQLEAASVGFIP
jgi:hypothetical protein